MRNPEFKRRRGCYRAKLLRHLADWPPKKILLVTLKTQELGRKKSPFYFTSDMFIMSDVAYNLTLQDCKPAIFVRAPLFPNFSNLQKFILSGMSATNCVLSEGGLDGALGP